MTAALVVQPWGVPGNFAQATVVRYSPTVADAFSYLDQVQLTLAKHGIALDAIELVVVDTERQPIQRPRVTL
jgi:hypothetical protein